MYFVYVLRDEVGRHYIGMTADLAARLEQHRKGGTQTTRRMSGQLNLVASRACETVEIARKLEREMKKWKNASKVITFLNTPLN